MRLTSRTVGIAAAVITILIWTSFIVVARAMALKSLTPLDIVLCRIVGASLVLLPWGFWMVRKMRRSNSPAPASWLGLSPLHWRVTCTVGAVGGVAYAVLAYSGFLYAPATHASVLMPGMLPLTTALLSVWLLRERLSAGRMAGLTLILCGGLLVGGASLVKALLGDAQAGVWRGDLLFVSASTCWALYTVTCRKHALAAVPATIAVIVFCALTYVPVYALLVAAGALTSHLGHAPWGEIAFHVFWQGLGSVVISGISFTRMVQHFGPVRSTMLTAVVPGLSALCAVLFLGEPLYWNLLAGLTLVTLGIVVGVRAASQAVPAATAEPAQVGAGTAPLATAPKA